MGTDREEDSGRREREVEAERGGIDELFRRGKLYLF
jgi:hypothetical protein